VLVVTLDDSKTVHIHSIEKQRLLSRLTNFEHRTSPPIRRPITSALNKARTTASDRLGPTTRRPLLDRFHSYTPSPAGDSRKCGSAFRNIQEEWKHTSKTGITNRRDNIRSRQKTANSDDFVLFVCWRYTRTILRSATAKASHVQDADRDPAPIGLAGPHRIARGPERSDSCRLGKTRRINNWELH
jgi:hypothetical protein